MFPEVQENELLKCWQETVQRLGDAPAVFGVDGGVVRTFSGIEQEARGIEEVLKGFRAQGSPLSARAVVAVQIGNSPVWPAALLALWRAGHVVLPLGRHMEAGDLDSALQVCGVSATMVCDPDGTLAPGIQLRLRNHGAPGPISWSGSVPHLLKLTSGTTSAPRAVRFRAKQLLADCRNICATMGIGAGDLNFGVIPFSHSYGFSNLITPLLVYGVPLVASEDRMPRAILAGLQASRATVFPGMPIFYQKLLDLVDRVGPVEGVDNVEGVGKPRRLPALRLCISAGAPLSTGLARAFAREFGLKIHTFYGASECGGIAYDRDGDCPQEGFVGSAMEGVHIETGDGSYTSHCSQVPEPARIVVRGEALGDGYFPASGDEALGDGCFSPSDLVEASAAGMRIVGRVSDVINVAGRKLNPMELEALMRECPGVSQVVVFGVTSPLRGEEPVACVVADPGVTVQAIRQYCQSHVSGWMRPRDIWLVPEIPVNERGKISRRVLAERYAAR